MILPKPNYDRPGDDARKQPTRARADDLLVGLERSSRFSSDNIRIPHHVESPRGLGFGVIVSAGPASEADYTDQRYWVKWVTPITKPSVTTLQTDFDPQTLETAKLLFGQNGSNIFTAFNLAEKAAGTHLVAVGTYVKLEPIETWGYDPGTLGLPSATSNGNDLYFNAAVPCCCGGSTPDTGDISLNTQHGTSTFATPGTISWTSGTGVTAVKGIVWGSGAAGGDYAYPATLDAGGGGGGGGCSIRTLAVVPSTAYSGFVGEWGTGVSGGGPTDGQDSWAISISDLLAKGGRKGDNSSVGVSGAGGLGGQASSGVGSTKFSGGDGGLGSPGINTNTGGGGGGGAGTNGNGGNGGDWSGGGAPGTGGAAGAGTGHTTGGTGGHPISAPIPLQPGGGGGGLTYGARGKVILIW